MPEGGVLSIKTEQVHLSGDFMKAYDGKGGRLRRDRGLRYGKRHGRAHERSDIRPLFYDKRSGEGDGPRPLDSLRDRPSEQGVCQCRQPAGHGDDLHRLLPPRGVRGLFRWHSGKRGAEGRQRGHPGGGGQQGREADRHDRAPGFRLRGDRGGRRGGCRRKVQGKQGSASISSCST